jgi:hypothetical protein
MGGFRARVTETRSLAMPNSATGEEARRQQGAGFLFLASTEELGIECQVGHPAKEPRTPAGSVLWIQAVLIRHGLATF